MAFQPIHVATQNFSRRHLAVLSACFLLPAALSAGLDTVRLIFLAFLFTTGGASLWFASEGTSKSGRRPQPDLRQHVTRETVIKSLRDAAATHPLGAKLILPSTSSIKSLGTQNSHDRQAEGALTTQYHVGERWQLSSDCAARLSLVSASPPLHVFEHFLTKFECETLIAVATPILVPSTTGYGIGSGSGDIRSSCSCLLSRHREVCVAVLGKVASLSRAPIDLMEDPQVARYECGQAYGPHCDGPELDDPQATPHEAHEFHANARVLVRAIIRRQALSTVVLWVAGVIIPAMWRPTSSHGPYLPQ